MAELMDHVSMIAEQIGPRPVSTEEEHEAAEYVAQQFKSAGLDVDIDEFTTPTGTKWPYAVSFGIVIIATLVSGLSVFLPDLTTSWYALSLLFTLVGFAIYFTERSGRPFLSKMLVKGVSQNVVAKYVPSSVVHERRRRKIIFVAHIDTTRAHLEANPKIVNNLPLIKKVIYFDMIGLLALLVLRVLPLPWPAVVDTVLLVISLIGCLLLLAAIVCIVAQRFGGFVCGANDNASSLAVIINLAQRFLDPKERERLASNKDAAGVKDAQEGGEQGAYPVEGEVTIHGEQASIAAGVVPEGAQIEYEMQDVPGAPQAQGTQGVLGAQGALGAQGTPAAPQAQGAPDAQGISEQTAPGRAGASDGVEFAKSAQGETVGSPVETNIDPSLSGRIDPGLSGRINPSASGIMYSTGVVATGSLEPVVLTEQMKKARAEELAQKQRDQAERMAQLRAEQEAKEQEEKQKSSGLPSWYVAARERAAHEEGIDTDDEEKQKMRSRFADTPMTSDDLEMMQEQQEQQEAQAQMQQHGSEPQPVAIQEKLQASVENEGLQGGTVAESAVAVGDGGVAGEGAVAGETGKGAVAGETGKGAAAGDSAVTAGGEGVAAGAVGVGSGAGDDAAAVGDAASESAPVAQDITQQGAEQQANAQQNVQQASEQQNAEQAGMQQQAEQAGAQQQVDEQQQAEQASEQQQAVEQQTDAQQQAQQQTAGQDNKSAALPWLSGSDDAIEEIVASAVEPISAPSAKLDADALDAESVVAQISATDVNENDENSSGLSGVEQELDLSDSDEDVAAAQTSNNEETANKEEAAGETGSDAKAQAATEAAADTEAQASAEAEARKNKKPSVTSLLGRIPTVEKNDDGNAAKDAQDNKAKNKQAQRAARRKPRTRTLSDDFVPTQAAPKHDEGDDLLNMSRQAAAVSSEYEATPQSAYSAQDYEQKKNDPSLSSSFSPVTQSDIAPAPANDLGSTSSFPSLTGSFPSLTGSIPSLTGTFEPVSAGKLDASDFAAASSEQKEAPADMFAQTGGPEFEVPESKLHNAMDSVTGLFSRIGRKNKKKDKRAKQADEDPWLNIAEDEDDFGWKGGGYVPQEDSFDGSFEGAAGAHQGAAGAYQDAAPDAQDAMLGTQDAAAGIAGAQGTAADTPAAQDAAAGMPAAQVPEFAQRASYAYKAFDGEYNPEQALRERAAKIRESVITMSESDMLDKEVWFVGLGASAPSNRGMKNFLELHHSELRGALIVNLEGIGCGDICFVDYEGSGKVYRSDRRLQSLVRKTSKDLDGEEMSAERLNWRDTDATPALNNGMRAMTIMGFDGVAPTAWRTLDDTIDIVEEDKLEYVADLLLKMIENA